MQPMTSGGTLVYRCPTRTQVRGADAEGRLSRPCTIPPHIRVLHERGAFYHRDVTVMVQLLEAPHPPSPSGSSPTTTMTPTH